MFGKFVRHAIIAATLLSSPAAAWAQSLVYVLQQGTLPFGCSGRPCHGPRLHLINTETGHDIAVINVASTGALGTSVRASADGTLLFVTIQSFSASSIGQLVVIDPFGKRVVGNITVGTNPSDVAVLPDRSRAYVVNSGDNTVSVVDLSTLSVLRTIAVLSAPSRIVAAPDGASVYVTNRGSESVSRVLTANDTISATIAVGTNPEDIDISPDGSRIFVANTGSLTVSVIDALSDSVLRNLPAGSGTVVPVDVSPQSGTRVYVGLQHRGSPETHFANPGSVDLLDAETGAVLGSVPLGPLGPGKVVRDPSGTPAYGVPLNWVWPLMKLATDGASATAVSPPLHMVDAAVVRDPCAFEASATTTFFGPSGGSGTLTIPAPPGCSWTIDTSTFPAVSVESPTSGTGSATRTFTVSSTTAPRLGTISIGRQALPFEQTIPRMGVDLASGSALAQPFTVTGWAIDEHAFSDGTAFSQPGIDAVHVWAYPASGAPIFVGTAEYACCNRPDVVAQYGLKYQLSGFRITIGTLPSGSYTLVFYAHSNRSGTFSNAQAVVVAVQQAPARIVIDAPGSTAATPFNVGGWAVDPAGAGSDGPGVDAVHVWAYPDGATSPIFLGAAQTGGARPDVAAYMGSAFARSGFHLANAWLPPGSYTLVVFARSTATGQFFAQAQRLTLPPSDPLMNVDAPPSTPITAPFWIAGWALDRAAATGTGVDAVHAWAYPVSGSAPIFVGAPAFTARPDVANAFGSRFLNSGFQLDGATLPPGTYDLVVFARSTVTRTYNNVQVIRITVQ
jgi:YVTN family beta-propeller protein